MMSMLSPSFARDVGCRANLMWRCDLEDPRRTEAFVDTATADVFVAVPDATRMGVAVFEEPNSGHRVVVVLRTGRVQVRLDALTPADARVDEARRVFERLQTVEAP
jgi:hypothetical protein